MSELKHYQCIKKVHAQPMTLGEFEETSAFAFPSTMARETEGYLVIYSQGTEQEYRSWSPKQAFDEGYVEISEGETH